MIKLREGDCDNARRNFLQKALAVAASVPAIAMTVRAAQAGQMPKTTVAYQDTPSDGKTCDQCRLFVTPNSCQVVAGSISPKGWCRLWSAKG